MSTMTQHGRRQCRDVSAPSTWSSLPDRMQPTNGTKTTGAVDLELGATARVGIVRPAGIGDITGDVDFRPHQPSKLTSPNRSVTHTDMQKHRTLLGLGLCRPHRTPYPIEESATLADETTDTAHDISPATLWAAREGEAPLRRPHVRPDAERHEWMRGQVIRRRKNLGYAAERTGAGVPPMRVRSATSRQASTRAGTNCSGADVQALCPPRMARSVAPGSARARASCRSCGTTSSSRVADDGRRHGRVEQSTSASRIGRSCPTRLERSGSSRVGRVSSIPAPR